MTKTSPSLTEFKTERRPRVSRATRYPFATLKPPVKKGKEVVYDTFFVPDATKEKTLRSQASRRGKALRRVFSVNRDRAVPEGGTEEVDGLRISRTK
jgi:hypothetical protein